MSHFLEISTRDPIIARDGRPFGATQGHRMKSLDWLYPSVTAGMVRTLLGEKHGQGFDIETVNLLKQIDVAGPLPMANSQLFFPAPQDLAVQESRGQHEIKRLVRAVRPCKIEDREGTDLPSFLRPMMLPDSIPDFKPAKAPLFWSAMKMTQWLLSSSGSDFEAPPNPDEHAPEPLLSLGYLKIEKDERLHVNIDPSTYAARDTHLFTTVALSLPNSVRISARIAAHPAFDSYLKHLNEWASMGGERRFVHVAAAENGDGWQCPSSIRDALAKTNLVRMVLATPALFEDGWKPGWINADGKGDFAGINLQLIGACVDRWKPISGWRYETPRGPKPTLRLAPAGSVYFFQAEGNASSMAGHWLKSVSDLGDGQSAHDGFGLALWGPWTPHVQ